MAINPDIPYLRSREEILTFEDARFNSLIQAVANFYLTRNEHSIWGTFLRVIAQELARLEYSYVYNLVAEDPRFLTPPDIKRRLAGSLFISKNYPSATQFDLDYKNTVVQLLPAYRQGATAQALSDIIFAYTGKNIVVDELYKEIGLFFDQSDRNSVRIAVNVGGTSSVTDINNINQLQSITNDLYSAIDLGKPAHVGLNFTTVFGTDEAVDLSTLSDTLRIFIRNVETQPLPAPLTMAPTLNPNSPITQQSAVGQVVGSVFSKLITTTQYNALLSQAFKNEYTGPDTHGNYSLNLKAYTDVALTSGPAITAAAWALLPPLTQATYRQGADGNYYLFTGAISTAVGQVAPVLNTAWEIASESSSLFEFD